MKVLWFISAFLFYSVASFGQTHKIDYLKRQVNAAKDNSSKLGAILNLCNEFESLPKDTLWNYAIKAKVLAVSLNDPYRKTQAIWAQAQAYIRWNNADSAKALVEPELPKYKVENAGTRELYFKLAQIKVDYIGNSNNYKDAIAQVYNVMHLAEAYKDSVVVAEDLNTLSAFYYDMNFLPQGRQWGLKGLSYTSNTPRFYHVMSGLCLNLADNYRWIGMLDSATYYINKATDLSTKIENWFLLSRCYEVKANIYSRKKNYIAAEKAMLKSIEILKKVDGDEPHQDESLNLAAVYRHAGQIDKAIKVLNDGLAADSAYQKVSPHAKLGDDARDLQRVFYYQELARCYQIKGDLKSYGAVLEKIIAGKDAFYTANSSQAIAELETKYETKKKEATIAKQRLALIQEEYFFYGSILFVVLAGIIIGLLFKDYKRKQKLRLQKLHDEEKLLSAQAVSSAQEKERKRIAADLHDNLGAQLSFIKRNVNFIMDKPQGFDQDDEKKYLGYVNDTAQNAMVDLRETIWVLNRDEVGVQEFADKLKSYLKQQLVDKAVTNWDFQDNITQNWKLTSGEVMHLFRIVQEVVSNIIKHSCADRILIELASHEPNTYELEIIDNGKGFDVNSKYDGHYGLENMQQRAKSINATLLFESFLGKGTRVLLTKGQNTSFELYNNTTAVNSFTQ